MFRKSLPHMGSFDSGITCRNNSGQYLTHLLETSNTGQVSDFVNQIPVEIGRCQVKEKKTKQGIAYLDWEMCYKEDVYVQKKDYVDEVQFIFFMNKGMEWQIGASDHSVCFKKGELCICRDCFQKSAACYEGGYNFLFKSVQIPSKLFFQMIEENFDLLDSSRINQMLKTVMKTGITPYMYRLLREIEDLDFYQGGIASLYLESKMTEIIAACLEAGMELGDNAVYKKMSLSRTDRELILQIKQRVDMDSVNIPGCEQLAREMNLSISKLTKGFKELTGVPLHTYVINRRLEYAAYLLTENHLNVSQAAVCAGYSNMSHFSAAFKKKYGVLPKDYKNKNC